MIDNFQDERSELIFAFGCCNFNLLLWSHATMALRPSLHYLFSTYFKLTFNLHQISLNILWIC